MSDFSLNMFLNDPTFWKGYQNVNISITFQMVHFDSFHLVAEATFNFGSVKDHEYFSSVKFAIIILISMREQLRYHNFLVN